MAELSLIRKGHNLVPVDGLSFDLLKSLPPDEVLRCKLSRQRNGRFHRLYYALLQVVFQNQELYPTLEVMHIAIKRAIGLVDEYEIKGQNFSVPRSISFAKMSRIEFEQFYETVLNLIITKIIPALDKADLEREIYEIIGD